MMSADFGETPVSMSWGVRSVRPRPLGGEHDRAIPVGRHRYAVDAGRVLERVAERLGFFWLQVRTDFVLTLMFS